MSPPPFELFPMGEKRPFAADCWTICDGFAVLASPFGPIIFARRRGAIKSAHAERRIRNKEHGVVVIPAEAGIQRDPTRRRKGCDGRECKAEIPPVSWYPGCPHLRT